MSYPSQDQQWDAAQKRRDEVARAQRPLKLVEPVEFSNDIPGKEFRRFFRRIGYLALFAALLVWVIRPW